MTDLALRQHQLGQLFVAVHLLRSLSQHQVLPLLHLFAAALQATTRGIRLPSITAAAQQTQTTLLAPRCARQNLVKASRSAPISVCCIPAQQRGTSRRLRPVPLCSTIKHAFLEALLRAQLFRPHSRAVSQMSCRIVRLAM